MIQQEALVAGASGTVASGELFAEFVAPKEPQRDKYYVLVAFYRGPGPKHNQWRVFCDDRWTSYEAVTKPAESLLEHHSPINVFVLDPEVKWSIWRKDQRVVSVNRIDGPVAQECPVVDEKELGGDVLRLAGEHGVLQAENEKLRKDRAELKLHRDSLVEINDGLYHERSSLEQRLEAERDVKNAFVRENGRLKERVAVLEREFDGARKLLQSCEEQSHKDAKENCELRARVQELERELERGKVAVALDQIGMNLPPVPLTHLAVIDSPTECDKLRVQLRKVEEERGELAIKLAEVQKSNAPKAEELCNEIDHAMRERNEARADLAAAKLEIRELNARIAELKSSSRKGES